MGPPGQHCTWFLPVQCYIRSIRATLDKSFFLCNLVTDRTIKTILQRIFLCNVVWSLSDSNAHGFCLRNVFAGVLQRTGFFPLQCCLEPLGQHIVQGFYLCNAVPRVLRHHRKSINTYIFNFMLVFYHYYSNKITS